MTLIDVVTDPATIGAYSPRSKKVAVDGTVRWTFRDKNPHTVTSDDGSAFRSAALAGGRIFEHRFGKSGTYAYHCNIHPEMHGIVVVG